ncbi:N-acetylmuramoyl-L-alanine amidase [Synechococcus sp. HK01-R]|uniref:N-acetylmuramoyl-L-alanine amidase n=1 Tax=Synechococcus sp. HK01-R TaxID=2751171 RepID=UPI0016232C16|nr:N-acetylmuramoyl-L-alanine amidase [Synechococcus sp. HK01-R]QNG27742.1 N-acetylmuramoyl-L-alanine amidase [Synechococcus sp. HK01-R]
MAATIYLHWTATGYDWIRPGHYHVIIGGDGRVHRLHATSVDLPAHTWARNSNAVALSCACMGGQPDPWTLPPTPSQLESLCAETAAIATSWGWSTEDITIQRVMTHAEAASNKDGRLMHDNYGPVVWGGTGERWDLLQLEKNGPLDGGEQLRRRIRELMAGGTSQTPRPPSQLSFKGATTIEARGEALAVAIDSEGRSWALAATLLERYRIPHAWDANQRRILIGSLDVAPTYRDDSVQASVGWPLFTMTLQTGNAPVILTGIVRPSDAGDRAWCRVLEFAEEFGISVRYDPFTLLKRRGG